jgi:hypothetical protein
VIFDAAGNLYGATGGGGISGFGTAFELLPPGKRCTPVSPNLWCEAVLYRFTGGSDGANPGSSLIFDKSGNLYGTTFYGGTSPCPGGYSAGCGTVFRLTPARNPNLAWTKTVLWSFSGGSDGANPYRDRILIFDAAGNLYGTTYYGGASSGFAGFGTVFELSPPTTTGGAWTEATLYRFTGGSDGANVEVGVTFDLVGNLYGATVQGGGGSGTLFELSPPGGSCTPVSPNLWCEATLHSFLRGEGWERVRVEAKDCPRISAEFLKEEMSALGPMQFSQEYECQFIDNETSVFNSEPIEAALTDDFAPFLARAA